ncbi:hypothetical protein TSAR_001113 [Trichomalopsis sarcophagae]|uniref:Uncharacterized protein n=1 Tax=Trichomalopsis sarcophagae TaxID=543379 RepID=A0A232ESR5_9HYME|nr:hypothetical protein TSAR_001113 [Trichomalopsis sarcophagae]
MISQKSADLNSSQKNSQANSTVKYALVNYLKDNVSKIVPIEYIALDRNQTKFKPLDCFDFDVKQKYYVQWFYCTKDGINCDNAECNHEYDIYSAFIKYLGETKEMIERQSQGKRLPVVNKKYVSTTESDDENDAAEINEVKEFKKEKSENKNSCSPTTPEKQTEKFSLASRNCRKRLFDNNESCDKTMASQPHDDRWTRAFENLFDKSQSESSSRDKTDINKSSQRHTNEDSNMNNHKAPSENISTIEENVMPAAKNADNVMDMAREFVENIYSDNENDIDNENQDHGDQQLDLDQGDQQENNQDNQQENHQDHEQENHQNDQQMPDTDGEVLRVKKFVLECILYYENARDGHALEEKQKRYTVN